MMTGTVTELAQHLGLSRTTTNSLLRWLERQGKARRLPSTPTSTRGRPPNQWVLPRRATVVFNDEDE